jgi:hypothetical protein
MSELGSHSGGGQRLSLRLCRCHTLLGSNRPGFEELVDDPVGGTSDDVVVDRLVQGGHLIRVDHIKNAIDYGNPPSPLGLSRRYLEAKVNLSSLVVAGLA